MLVLLAALLVLVLLSLGRVLPQQQVLLAACNSRQQLCRPCCLQQV
jgi:hypothetical protein